MELLAINDYLSFAIEQTPDGKKITALVDGVSIGYKDPCKHTKCIMTFVAQMTIAAEEIHQFEKENLN
jgi:hypothetical protein